jgi:5-(carboxyamino)imidazole ribonucleotide synthase
LCPETVKWITDKRNKDKKFMLEKLRTGILGGGHYRTRLLPYALRSGFSVSAMHPDGRSPWSGYRSGFKQGDPSVFDELIRFGEGLEVLTVADDSANIEALRQLEAQGVRIYPSPDTIAVIQDRNLQMECFKADGIPSVTGWVITGEPDHDTFSLNAQEHQDKSGHAGVRADLMAVRIREGRTDEREAADVESVMAACRELQVTVARNERGVIECYDPALMILNDGKLFMDFTTCKGSVSRQLAISACELAASVAVSVNLIGLITVELILAGNGKLYVSHLTTNPAKQDPGSGISDEDCEAEQHLRFLLGREPGDAGHDHRAGGRDILEPAAYRNGVIRSALTSLLATDNLHHAAAVPDALPSGCISGPNKIDSLKMDEEVDKAIMIRYLLQ